MIQITSVEWSWGFQDSCQGKSIYEGYFLIGANLVEYKRGWFAGRKATVARYVPFQNPEMYKDVLPAEQREDWVGE